MKRPTRSSLPLSVRGRSASGLSGEGVWASLRASKLQGGVMPEVLLDAAGRPRSPATFPGFHAGRSPRNKGQRYPPDPPTLAEIVAVMRHAGTGLEVEGRECRAGRR
jgi:hypothetical protein